MMVDIFDNIAIDIIASVNPFPKILYEVHPCATFDIETLVVCVALAILCVAKMTTKLRRTLPLFYFSFLGYEH